MKISDTDKARIEAQYPVEGSIHNKIKMIEIRLATIAEHEYMLGRMEEVEFDLLFYKKGWVFDEDSGFWYSTNYIKMAQRHELIQKYGKRHFACSLDEQGCSETCHGDSENKMKCEFCTVTYKFPSTEQNKEEPK